MEENHYEDTSSMPQEPKLIIDHEIRRFLIETTKWSKFLAILGFVLAAIIVLLGLGFLIFGSTISRNMPEQFAFTGALGIVYMALGLLYYFPAKYLYDFSLYIRQALAMDNQESLVYAFSRLKALYRFWGILALIAVVLYAVIIVFAIIAGMAGLMLR